MGGTFKFSRLEFAGSFGDLGTLLPLATGFILINGMDPLGLFFGVGIFYIFTGVYFKVTSPVEPMKVIAAYSIASGISMGEIQASCLWVFIILLFLGLTGLITQLSKYIKLAVIRGVQLSTGFLLISMGLNLILGSSSLQQSQGRVEPSLFIQQLWGLPISLILGVVLGVVTLLLLDNKKTPAALVVIAAGLAVGLGLGDLSALKSVAVGINFPSFLPAGLPSFDDFGFALLFLILPQIPMTVGNAVIANKDLSDSYFKDVPNRVTHRSLCISMALGNLLSFFIGGMPVCHGAGGLASRYRFGARTGGSNIMIGVIFLLIAILFGNQALIVFKLLPLSVLGVLLLFAGLQLALTIIDMKSRQDLFIVFIMLGVTLVSNLGIGFMVGIMISMLFTIRPIKI